LSARPAAAEGRDLALQHAAEVRVLVAEVDPAGLGLDGVGGDQHAFQHAVRLLLQAVAVLEGAGLALVGVDH
jgi:hypothetical protein